MSNVTPFPTDRVRKPAQDLNSLLRAMSPFLSAETYAYAKVSAPALDAGLRGQLTPIMEYHEDEGVTVIAPKSRVVDAGLTPAFLARRISLMVESELTSVGLVAAVASVLASEGIAVNPVAGIHHDHLFVPVDRAEEAMDVLEALWSDAQDENFDFLGEYDPDEDMPF